MISGIYYIKNNINNKYYIGQSVNIKHRKQHHFAELRHNTHRNVYLQNAFNKYSENAFEFKLIKACKPRYLNRFEKMYIKIYDSYNNGYNLTEGGENPPILKGKNNPFYGKKHSDESCLQMSKKQNSTGFFRVYSDGQIYKYRWYENGKRCSISAKDINVLKQKVIERGLKWKQISDSPDTPSLYKGRTLSLEQKIEKSKQQNTTGYYRVTILREKNRQPRYSYRWREDGKRKSLSSVDINKLEEKIKSKGLPWYKLKD